MHPIIRFSALWLALLFSLPALAMNLNQAMNALPAAKEAGHLGEQPDGYLGVVNPVGEAREIARLINEARRAEYQHGTVRCQDTGGSAIACRAARVVVSASAFSTSCIACRTSRHPGRSLSLHRSQRQLRSRFNPVPSTASRP